MISNNSAAERRDIAAELAAALPLVSQPIPGVDLVARPLAEEDAGPLLEMLGNDPAMTWTRKTWTAENVNYLLKLRLEHYENGFGVFAVTDSDGVLLGMAGLQFWDDDSVDVEVIAYVRRDLWARGIAKSALQWCVDTAFAQCPGVRRIIAATRHDNAAAQSLAKRLGMTSTGEGDHYGAPSIFWELKRA